MKHSEYSVIIVGSGAAGLFAALKISSQIELPQGILLVTKSSLGSSNSNYAQGGIVGVMEQNIGDSVELHVKDTIRAGAGLTDETVAKYISNVSNTVINDLIEYGVQFDKDNSGKISFTLEAAHSFNRIMHVGGDATGHGIIKELKARVLECDNITVVEDAMAVELLVDNNESCKGIILYSSNTNEHEVVYSSATILATGGLGQLYKYTTNPIGATGDGIALAYNAGATIKDMEFVQFHPTALALPNLKNRFLISEAVRGEGAKLIDASGNQFMSKYHEKKELAPRDIVTRSIYNEIKQQGADNMYLDATKVGKEKLLQRFPTIYKRCLKSGIDISEKPIPVAPAAHYLMGGIKATVEGKTSINGLYAIGEAACTGLHGANRLASNSLLECIVCAYELANYLSFLNLEAPKCIDSNIISTIHLYEDTITDTEYNITELKESLKELMWNNVGILRSEQGLKNALNLITSMCQNFERNRKCQTIEEYEYRNMLTNAQIIITSALRRQESRGAHSRTDYVQTDNVATHTDITKQIKKEQTHVE